MLTYAGDSNLQLYCMRACHIKSAFLGHVFSLVAAFLIITTTLSSSAQAEAKNPSSAKKVSVWKAIGMSALVPGAGQYYAGRKSQGRMCMGAEAAVWTTYGGLSLYAGWKKNDYRRWAQLHAGVDPANEDDEFYRALTFYLSRDEYNELGRAFTPTAPYYPDAPLWDWRWESADAQTTYRQLRNEQRSAERNAEFMFVAAGVNRLLSMFMAWRAALSHNGRIEGRIDEFGESVLPQAPTLTALFSASIDGASTPGVMLRASF